MKDTALVPVRKLVSILVIVLLLNQSIPAQVAAGQAPAAILERFRWEISIWTPDDRKKFDDAMKAARDAAR